FGKERLARKSSPEPRAHLTGASVPFQERFKTKIYALGGDHIGRIDTRPASIGQPNLTPCMGIGLPHQIEVAHFVELAAEITNDHTGRHSGQPHQCREAGRVMFAEADTSAKEK